LYSGYHAHLLQRADQQGSNLSRPVRAETRFNWPNLISGLRTGLLFDTILATGHASNNQKT